MPRFHAITEVTFEAAHTVPGHPKCGNLHGHTWRVVVSVSAPQLGLTSDYPFVLDYTILKDILNELVPDHKYMNEVYDFVPTSERLSEHFFNGVRRELAMRHHEEIAIDFVEVWEGLKNHARYEP